MILMSLDIKKVVSTKELCMHAWESQDYKKAFFWRYKWDIHIDDTQRNKYFTMNMATQKHPRIEH